MDPLGRPAPRYERNGDQLIPNGIPAEVRDEMSPPHNIERMPRIKVIPSPIKVAADMARAMEKGG